MMPGGGPTLPSPIDRFARASASRRWLIGTLIAAGGICLLALNRGWEPVGEGAIAQSAERVLQGEVPHRDFDDLYTGALTYVHAAAFALGGVRLSVLRIPLLLVALAWVAAFYAVSRRLVPPVGAALLTMLALAWSVPNDPSPMPSWYNLFFATFAVLALVRWIETRGTGWLVLAGACGGASFLMKLSGLFLLAALGLFLIEASRPEGPTREKAAGGRSVQVAITLGLGLFVALLWKSVAPRGSLGVMHFVLPVAVLALGLAVREWTAPAVGSGARLRSLARAWGPFVAGAAAMIAPFALFLAVVGGLDDAVRGVFVTPFRRLDAAGMQPPRAHWLAAVVPLFLLLRPRIDHRSPAWRLRSLLAAMVLGGVLVLGSITFFTQQLAWYSLRSLAPLLGLMTGIIVAVDAARLGWTAAGRHLVILLGMVAVLHSLIQFPFAGPNYFYYVVPLVFLATAGLVRLGGRTPLGLQLAVCGFYLSFAVLEVMPGSQAGLTILPGKRPAPVPVDLPRVGLLVGMDQARLYESLVPFLQETAAAGRIWAGPEAPQVYFLGGFRNPTRTFYNFFDPASRQESGLLARMEREGIDVAVINTRPAFSPPLPAELLDSLAARYPFASSHGPFVVRWR